IRSHAAVALRSKVFQFLNESPFLIEKLLGFIAAKPVFQYFQMLGMADKIGDGNLMRAPRSFNGLAVYNLGPRPTLRRAQDDHRPHGHAGSFSFPRILL